ncbi:hypothetical protein Q4E93_18485 [Flavitalea sp. BT771]|uniref:hypothetical protein n=1 Tax=Flavitalea sp. BT771 TaxID=3063329 RepID=UPI0026E375E8|nr:hypothetical protein [Flavitalea sp. BT771]MDO6432600.1 hypothetical protein [Flavitalea sp. BT771]MDV6222124.1 hypothetical protein [Flavitalea sp. BT771]
MKLTFFLIAFCLVFLRVYFKTPWTGNGDKNHVSITIKSGDDYEQIKYAGKIELSEDERAIRSISPGGYIKYRHNEVRLLAEGGIQEKISYEIRDHGEELDADAEGRRVVREALREMIAFGFGGRDRMMRLYEKGGNRALLDELDHLRSTDVSRRYLDFVLSSHPLPQEDISAVIARVGSMGSDADKVHALGLLIDADSISTHNWIGILSAAGKLNANEERRRLLLPAADKIPGDSLVRSAYEQAIH